MKMGTIAAMLRVMEIQLSVIGNQVAFSRGYFEALSGEVFAPVPRFNGCQLCGYGLSIVFRRKIKKFTGLFQ